MEGTATTPAAPPAGWRLIWCLDSPGWGGSERDLVRVIDMIGWESQQLIVHGNPLDARLADALSRRRIPRLSIRAGSRLLAMPRAWLAADDVVTRNPRAVWIVWAHHFDTCRWLQQRLAWGAERFVLAERTMARTREDLSRSRLTIPLKRNAVRHCAAAVLPGERQALVFREIFGVAAEKIRCIPNSRDVNGIWARASALRRDRASARTALGLPPGKPLVVCVARMDPGKGQEILVQAMARLRAGGTDAHLCLVGTGPSGPAVETLCHRLIPGAFTLAGERDDPIYYLAAADVFAFPSRFEGLSGALIEAMAAGLPVVASDIPGSRDLVADGVTGRLFPMDDVPALADRIQEVLGDPEGAASTAERGRAWVARRHDSSVEQREWRRLVSELTGEAAWRPRVASPGQE